ncbi:ribonuclease [Niabella ginsenosidivorans]|uniref:Ribonuclease n=1 Tax=Niabella ginsenosidivorans TaxID=1176587 RepID=A0A1A9I474_9BACT|nr:ribonuclease domain-containing protein [Niabella ginsenosidivorans]ANH82426.1 ribonuclease [Niabella ginsenosidivorans]
MQKQKRSLLWMLLIIAALVYYWYSHKKGPDPALPVTPQVVKTDPSGNTDKNIQPPSQASVEELTKESAVVPYVKQNGHLPDYYITKREARSKGWEPSKGNLCMVLPGRAIGGDIFSNRERSLPEKQGRKWFEADINFSCGRRNADRLLFSSDGLVFVTKDHYRTFQEK